MLEGKEITNQMCYLQYNNAGKNRYIDLTFARVLTAANPSSDNRRLNDFTDRKPNVSRLEYQGCIPSLSIRSYLN